MWVAHFLLETYPRKLFETSVEVEDFLLVASDHYEAKFVSGGFQMTLVTGTQIGMTCGWWLWIPRGASPVSGVSLRVPFVRESQACRRISCACLPSSRPWTLPPAPTPDPDFSKSSRCTPHWLFPVRCDSLQRLATTSVSHILGHFKRW